METFDIDIQTRTKTISMNKARIWVRQVKLFDYAYIDVRLLDDQNLTQECLTFKLDGIEYKEWNNDQYLIDWVKNKLNI